MAADLPQAKRVKIKGIVYDAPNRGAVDVREERNELIVRAAVEARAEFALQEEAARQALMRIADEANFADQHQAQIADQKALAVLEAAAAEHQPGGAAVAPRRSPRIRARVNYADTSKELPGSRKRARAESRRVQRRPAIRRRIKNNVEIAEKVKNMLEVLQQHPEVVERDIAGQRLVDELQAIEDESQKLQAQLDDAMGEEDEDVNEAELPEMRKALVVTLFDPNNVEYAYTGQSRDRVRA